MIISKKVYLFNLFILTIISFEVFYSSFIISYAPTNAYFVLIGIYLVSILLLAFLPIRNYNLSKIINNNKIIKIILSIYLFLFLTIIISYSTTILNHWFYHKSPIIIILIVLSITILLLSNNIGYIFNMGAILSLFLGFLNMVPVFNSIPRTFDFVLTMNYKIDFKLIFLALFMYLDLLIEIFFTPFVKEKITKKEFIITISISSLISLILMLENYFFFNSDFLKTSSNPNYLKYKIYFINYLIDNIDIILLFNILYYTIFKGAKYLYLFKVINNIKLKHKDKIAKLTNLILLLIIVLISNYIVNIISKDRLLIKNYTNALNIIIIVIYLFLNIKLRRMKNEPILLSNID